MRQVEKLLEVLEKRYREKTKRSLEVYHKAEKVMVRGGSHTLRIWYPYPLIISKAQGPLVFDIEGNSYVDYWQGHYANILGHNPSVILEELREICLEGSLHTGFEGEAQIELAELLLAHVGYPDYKVRFTTSGTLATMYAVMLGKAHTGREYVLKVGGGWHGASPYLLKGVRHYQDKGFDQGESAGVSKESLRKILITRFNDLDDLARIFKNKGNEIACFIIEPFVGAGGFIAASKEYLNLARELTEKYGVALIFDEVVSGFRFCPSGVQKLYNIQPDLSTYGKLIGGGHAVAAVVGRPEIMQECEPSALKQRVLFEGGTFSAHSEYMKAGCAMIRYLIEKADLVYPKIAKSGARLRKSVEEAFRREGIEALCTGYENEVISGSSLFALNFPSKKLSYLRPDEVLNEEISDLRLREEALKLGLLVEGVHVVHGGGAVSFTHEEEHIEKTIAAYAKVAGIFKNYL